MSSEFAKRSIAGVLGIVVLAAVAVSAHLGGVSAAREEATASCPSKLASKTTKRGTLVVGAYTKRKLCAVFTKADDRDDYGTPTKVRIVATDNIGTKLLAKSAKVEHYAGPYRIKAPQFAESACAVTVSVTVKGRTDEVTVMCSEYAA